MSDTERFVDSWSEKPIPSKDTWDNLSVPQLLEVRTQLQDKLWTFQNNPQIATVLKQSVQYITQLIDQRGMM